MITWKGFVATLNRLWRQKGNSAIIIASLALGLAISSLLLLYVKRELSYDRGWDDAEEIHRLLVDIRNVPNEGDQTLDSIPQQILPDLLEYLGDDVLAVARDFTIYASIHHGELSTSRNLTFADPAYVDIFTLEEVSGDLRGTLLTPGSIAISEEVAAALSLGEDAIGARVQVQGDADELEFEVGAVFRSPDLSVVSFTLQALTPMHDSARPLLLPTLRNDWPSRTSIWFRLRADESYADWQDLLVSYMASEPDAFANWGPPGRALPDHVRLWLQPLVDMRLNPTDFRIQSNKERVATFAAIAVIILLAGSTNALGLSMASTVERRQEIGIRKSVGASRLDIVMQYLGESLVLILMAILLAWVLIYSLLPVFTALLAIGDLPTPVLEDAILLACAGLVLGLLGSLYPALVLSGAGPQGMLKTHSQRAAGEFSLRQYLVGGQFVLALMLSISVVALLLQLALVRQQPLGFKAQGLYLIPFLALQEPEHPEALLDRLRQVPGITGADFILQPPNANNLHLATTDISTAAERDRKIKIERMSVSSGHLDLLQVPVLAGRSFEPGQEYRTNPGRTADDLESALPTVLNRRAAAALGFSTPETAVGEFVYWDLSDSRSSLIVSFEVIGVVEDNMYESLRSRPAPEMYVYSPPVNPHYILIRYQESVASTIAGTVRSVWDEQTGLGYFIGQNLSDIVNDAWSNETREMQLLMICSALALGLSCIGLFGLVSFTLKHKVKEVGVRKALGAGVGDIVGLFLWRFTKPVLAANVIAWLTALYFILQWLEKFPYQLDKAWLLPICLGASLGVLAIALLTVSVITVQAAQARPIASLRYE